MAMNKKGLSSDFGLAMFIIVTGLLVIIIGFTSNSDLTMGLGICWLFGGVSGVVFQSTLSSARRGYD